MAEPNKGRVGISRDVVTAIAAIAVSEIAGIANLRPNDKALHRGEGMKRYVDTEVEGESVKVTVRLTLLHGNPILRVAKEVQRSVKAEIESMTGLRVTAVDVDVQRLVKAQEPQEEEEG
jgi:uncharacterized alkaline shock family protein YloU